MVEIIVSLNGKLTGSSGNWRWMDGGGGGVTMMDVILKLINGQDACMDG